MNVLLFIMPKRMLCSFPFLDEWKQDFKTSFGFVLASDSEGTVFGAQATKNTDDVRCNVMHVVLMRVCFRVFVAISLAPANQLF